VERIIIMKENKLIPSSTIVIIIPIILISLFIGKPLIFLILWNLLVAIGLFNPLRRNPRGFSAEGGSASGGSPGMNAVDSIFASGRKPRTFSPGRLHSKTHLG
jgi:hypothetical protein